MEHIIIYRLHYLLLIDDDCVLAAEIPNVIMGEVYDCIPRRLRSNKKLMKLFYPRTLLELEFFPFTFSTPFSDISLLDKNILSNTNRPLIVLIFIVNILRYL